MKSVINQKKDAVGSYNLSTNAGIGTYSDKVLYKIGRVCICSFLLSATRTGTGLHIVSVPDACKPLAFTWMSVSKYGETKGSEVHIETDGRMLAALIETGDHKIFGAWITAS